MRSKVSFSKTLFAPILVLFTVLFFCLPILAQSSATDQAVDEEYTRLIKEATTKPEFLSPLTSYLPRVEGVPTPKDVLGYIAGAPGKLTYYADILKYMKALAKASPNVEVFAIGKTSEGREMVVVAVAASETMRNLQKYKDLMAKLADPRQVKTEQEAEAIIAQAKPIYWLTGNLHSGESGAAECSMELAYRLAVDDNPIVKKIRDSMIVLITPSV
ncbi:MAG: M14 family zinc carboxypeptidase, partial [Candidatus Aminicenantes bacterium]|nr:M14 family zinc carboxypeptidase [Candidatus Aminicenantes bacterium]